MREHIENSSFFGWSIPTIWQYIPIVLVLVVGVALSVGAFKLVEASEQKKVDTEFRATAAQKIDTLADQVESDLDALQAVEAFYAASTIVDRDEFRTFTSSIFEKHSSILALEWVPKVNLEERAEFERSSLAEDIAYFQIRDLQPDGTSIISPKKEEYFPVYFIEPFWSNDAAMGLDMASEPKRSAALMNARDSGELTTTERIVLVQRPEGEFGILAFQPIYKNGTPTETIEERRQNLHGFALGVFNLGDIIVSVVPDAASNPSFDNYQIALFDRSAPPGQQLLYPRGFEDIHNVEPGRTLRFSDSLAVGNRNWEAVIFAPTPSLGFLPWGVLLAGLGFTSLIALYATSVIRRAVTVERLVTVRTEELSQTNERLELEILERSQVQAALKENEARFRSVIQSANDMIIIADEDGKIISWNESARRVFGYSVEEVIGQPVTMLMPERHRDAHQKGLERASATGESTLSEQTVELEALKKNGSEFPVELSLAIWQAGDRRFFSGILRDITDRKLRERELDRFFALSPDMLCIASMDGHFLRVNDAFEKILGYTPEELMAQPFLDLIHPEDVPVTLVEIEKLSAGHKTILFGNRYRCKDGSYRILSWTATPEPEEGLIYATARDVTTRKQEREELFRINRQNELILNSAGEGIYGLDLDGKVTFMNPAAARMLGWEMDDLLGQYLHDLIHHTRPDGSAYHKKECPIFHAFQDGEIHQSENEIFWRKDGTNFPVEFISTPLTDEGEKILGAVVAFQDISQRMAVAQMKDEFISVVSHELRTPLTSIRGSLGLVAGGVMGELPAKVQDMVEIAVKNAERLVRLINDILDIEKIESGSVSMEKRACTAQDLIQQSVDVMKDMATAAGVTISTSLEDCEISADPDRIIQTLTNLLSNAIKFSPAESTINVIAKQAGNELRVSVSDQGRGIPQDKLESIFERFQQVDASDSRQKGGTGLGLAICRSIVEQHGGRIWVESVIDQGSTFHITLPQLVSETEESPRNNSASNSPTVLVCDDDVSNLEVARKSLEFSGYHVMVAVSGEEALDIATSNQPSVILMDIVMPGLNGWQIIAELQRRPETKNIPVVVFSAIFPPKNPIVGNPREWISKSGENPLGSLLQALTSIVRPDQRVPKVLVVEDDLDLANILVSIFRSHDLEAMSTQTGQQAIELYQSYFPDMVVLDMGLPDIGGLEVVKAVRKNSFNPQVPILVYTARDLTSEEYVKLQEAGVQCFNKGRITPEEFNQQVLKLVENISEKETPEEVCAPDE